MLGPLQKTRVMTQYLSIITAYGAVAILAWLAALLYPRLIPASAISGRAKRSHRIAAFGGACLAAFALEYARRSSLLFDNASTLLDASNQLIVFLPFLAYIALFGGRGAALIPQTNLLRSLAIGVCLAILALAAFVSSASLSAELPALARSLLQAEIAVVMLKTMLQGLAVAAFLALVADGWSVRVALALAALAIAIMHVPILFESGFSVKWLGTLLLNLAIGLGLLSAVLATRNIVWFLPVYAMMTLAQTHLD